MRIFEKLFAILNIVFIFTHIFTFDVGTTVSWMTFGYVSVFLWLMVLNYFLEGLKLQSLLYLVAHPLLVYSEVAEEDYQKGMSLGFFIAVCITAMTLVLFFS